MKTAPFPAKLKNTLGHAAGPDGESGFTVVDVQGDFCVVHAYTVRHVSEDVKGQMYDRWRPDVILIHGANSPPKRAQQSSRLEVQKNSFLVRHIKEPPTQDANRLYHRS